MAVFKKGDQLRVADNPAQETALRFEGFKPVKDEDVSEKDAKDAKPAADKAPETDPAKARTPQAGASNTAPRTN
jgi:hypothetical protein